MSEETNAQLSRDDEMCTRYAHGHVQRARLRIGPKGGISTMLVGKCNDALAIAESSFNLRASVPHALMRSESRLRTVDYSQHTSRGCSAFTMSSRRDDPGGEMSTTTTTTTTDGRASIDCCSVLAA